MLAKVLTCDILGLEGALVEVEVDISAGLPSFTIVGLPDTAVQEARKRVRAAIKNSGCAFPNRKITVNLAPADLKKEGPAYDLPIAVGILISSEQISNRVDNTLFLGELSLDGTLRHTHGILPMVSLAAEKGMSQVFVPAVDAREASLIKGTTILPFNALSQLVSHFRGEIPPILVPDSIIPTAKPLFLSINLCDIKGQEHAKRALEVAAAGGHNMMAN